MGTPLPDPTLPAELPAYPPPRRRRRRRRVTRRPLQLKSWWLRGGDRYEGRRVEPEEVLEAEEVLELDLELAAAALEAAPEAAAAAHVPTRAHERRVCGASAVPCGASRARGEGCRAARRGLKAGWAILCRVDHRRSAEARGTRGHGVGAWCWVHGGSGELELQMCRV